MNCTTILHNHCQNSVERSCHPASFFFFPFFFSVQKNIIFHITTLAEKMIKGMHSKEMLLFSKNTGIQLSIFKVFKIDTILFLILYDILSIMCLFNISVRIQNVKIQRIVRNALLCWIQIKQSSFLMENSILPIFLRFPSLKIHADIKE